MQIFRAPIFVGLAILSAACASGEAVRDLAKQTASLAETYQAATKEFADFQNDLLAEDERRIALINAAAQDAQADSDTLVKGWTLANDKPSKEKLDRFNLMSAPKSADILASMAPAPRSASTPITGVKVAEQVKALRELGEAPSLFDQARFFAGFGQAVFKRMTEIQKEATKDADNAAVEADEAARKTAESAEGGDKTGGS